MWKYVILYGLVMLAVASAYWLASRLERMRRSRIQKAHQPLTDQHRNESRELTELAATIRQQTQCLVVRNVLMDSANRRTAHVADAH